MGNIYLYADEESRQVLLDKSQKLISIGSDFGYGNFGDIVQSVNSLKLAKKSRQFTTVSILAANAIGFKEFPQWVKNSYGSDAVIFVAEYPLILDENSPSLKLVSEIRNIALVHMYGGGFLNDMWGDFILGVVEYFLRISESARYIVSGQQITHPFESRLLRHIEKFKPVLFGVRDELSRSILGKAGFDAGFSFDDASELLVSIAERLLLRKGSGLFLHLNVSSYTANNDGADRLGEELKLVEENISKSGEVTLLQAFKDARPEVRDSREALKFLDYRFPFNDVRLIELTPFAYGVEDEGRSRPVVGEFGYSCSYHVALCLQLAGIPCWLRSSNSFYDQKSKALQVSQGLSEFLREPRLADHRTNLERRAQWLDTLEKAIEQSPVVNKISHVPPNNDGPAPWGFFFKGTPTLEEKLELAEQQNSFLLEKIEESELVLQLRMQVDGLRTQLTDLGAETHLQRQRAEGMLLVESELREEMARRGEGWLRLEMALHEEMARRAEVWVGAEQVLRAEITQCNAQIAGQAALVQSLAEAEQRASQLDAQLAQMLRSRSWRLTRPLRAIARFARSGHFDSRGEVGLFGIAQRIGRRLPLSMAMRARIGRLLSKFRRQGGK